MEIDEAVGKWKVIGLYLNTLELLRSEGFSTIGLMLRTGRDGIFDNLEIKFYKPMGNERQEELLYILLSSSWQSDITTIPFLRIGGESVAQNMIKIKKHNGAFVIGIDKRYIRSSLAESFLPLNPLRLVEISSNGIMIDGFKTPIKHNEL